MKTREFEPHCRLRTLRRSWGLNRAELALLLGYKSASHISRIESGTRLPVFETALACQVIFGLPPAELFPHAYSLVEERVIGVMAQAHLTLEKTTSEAAFRKRELYEAALSRAVDGINQPSEV